MSFSPSPLLPFLFSVCLFVFLLPLLSIPLKDELCMHLTNYAINKHSKDFVIDEETGSKRRITTMNKWFEENGYNLQKIWDNIDVSE